MKNFIFLLLMGLLFASSQINTSEEVTIDETEFVISTNLNELPVPAITESNKINGCSNFLITKSDGEFVINTSSSHEHVFLGKIDKSPDLLINKSLMAQMLDYDDDDDEGNSKSVKSKKGPRVTREIQIPAKNPKIVNIYTMTTAFIG